MLKQSLSLLPPGAIPRAGNVHRYDQENPFEVNWIVSNLCNYSCSYCSEAGVYNNRVRRMVDLVKCVDAVAGLDRKRVKFTLTGGEPTIHPDFMELVQYILDTLGERCFIHIMTNLSRSPKFYQQFVEQFRDYASQIDFDASIHPEQVNLERFEQAATILSEAGFVCVGNVLAHPLYMKIVRRVHAHMSSLELANFRARSPKVVIFSGNTPNPPVFTPEDLQWLGIGQTGGDALKNLFVDRIADTEETEISRCIFDRNPLIASGENNFKGLLCNAGVDMIAVDQSGNVDRAVCFRGSGMDRLNVYEDQDPAGRLGNPVRCPFEQCFCGSDLMLPKYLEPEFGPRY